MSEVLKMLVNVPKYKKIVMCLTGKKKCMLDKLYEVLSYSGVGHNFNINESTIHTKSGVFKQKHK